MEGKYVIMLSLINIDVKVGHQTSLERQVLKQLNLTVNQGEFIILIGGNGAGKSTLFQAIAGTVLPDAGQILLDNQDITQWPAEKRAGFIAKVLQDPRQATIAPMTIEENLSFAFKRGQPRGLHFHNTHQRREFFQERLLMLKMGLENRLDELVGHLSGGQRQALSLVMALLQNARILLLDEITAALDPQMADKIMELTTSLVKEEGQTTVMITHNPAHMQGYGHRTLELKDGQIAA